MSDDEALALAGQLYRLIVKIANEHSIGEAEKTVELAEVLKQVNTPPPTPPTV